MTQQFILIGGAPTTGKSTIARAVAKHLGLPWISTDQLREVVRPYGNKDSFPYLYDTTGLSAEEFLSKYTPQEISDMEFLQGADVWPAVKGVFKNTWDWLEGGVIEGVNILPHLVSEKYYTHKEKVRPIFLVDLDKDRMRKVVYTRGLYDDADKYSDDVKEKEVEWAMLFAHRLKSEAEKYGFPCIEITKTDCDLDRVLNAIKAFTPPVA